MINKNEKFISEVKNKLNSSVDWADFGTLKKYGDEISISHDFDSKFRINVSTKATSMVETLTIELAIKEIDESVAEYYDEIIKKINLFSRCMHENKLVDLSDSEFGTYEEEYYLLRNCKGNKIVVDGHFGSYITPCKYQKKINFNDENRVIKAINVARSSINLINAFESIINT